MSDYESDDAPEAVDFSTSKSLALQEVKAAADAVKQTRQKQKEARQKRQELFQQQRVDKLAKLEELKKNAPSDDIFDQLPDKFERKPKVRSKKVPTLTQFVESEQQPLDDDEGLDESEDFLNLDSSMPQRKVKRITLREEQHGSTTFRIMSSNDQRRTNHISENVLNFRKAHTFGKLSRVKRESALERSRREAKIRLSGKDVFCM